MSPNVPDEQGIFARLLLDEEKALEGLDLLVRIAEEFFRLDPKRKTVVLTDLATRTLTVKETISVYLSALYWGAAKIRVGGEPIFKTDGDSVAGIAQFLRKKPTDISGRLTELVREGVVSKDEAGTYRINYYKIEAVLSSIRDRLPAPDAKS